MRFGILPDRFFIHFPPPPRNTPGMFEHARHPDLARYLNEHALRRGRFTLVSGRVSSYYCDGKLVSFSGQGALLIAEAAIREMQHLRVDAIGGMDMGATPIVSAVVMRLFQMGRPLPAFIVRKQVKGHGTRKPIEGPLPETPARLVMIDDVVTSGGSLLQAIDVVRGLGHTVELAISVLDRDGGGAELMRVNNVPYQPLVTIAELGITNDEPSAAIEAG